MSSTGEKSLTPTQLCVINALHGDQMKTKRRLSQVMPLDQQTDEILANYGALPPSVPYHCEIKGRNKRLFIWKNLVGVSCGILCLLVSYDAFFYVQSSLNSFAGLGSLSLAVDYGAQVLSSLFLPAMLMKKIGCKWTLVVSMLGVILYIATNFYPHFATLIPAAFIMGIGFSSMWATMNTFVSDLAVLHARITGVTSTVTISRFFGIFYMTIQTAKIWGNLISSQILVGNADVFPNISQLNICGARYCNQRLSFYKLAEDNRFNESDHVAEANATEVSSRGGVTRIQLFTLCGVSLGIALLALLLVAALLDSSRSKIPLPGTTTSRFLSTVKLLGDYRLLLVVVLTIDAGLVQSFFAGDFTKAFMTCSLGIHHVGLVSTCYGVTAVFGSIALGYLAQWIGRPSLIIIAIILNLSDLLMMLFWTLDPNIVIMYYLMAGIWGLALSIWLTQLSAFYADVFRDRHEEAFSNHRMLECVGFVIGFTWEHFLCMTTKIYITVVLLLVGLIGYIAVEVLFWWKKKDSCESNEVF